ncbi:MAG: LamG-like jellyroll fold domain-containing protein [Bacteroidota bacterium]
MKQRYTIFYLFLGFILLWPLAQIEAQTSQYLHFDRVDDFVEVPNASQYVANAQGITMAGWFYTDQLAYGQGMMGIRGGSGAGEMYLIQLDNGIIECRFKNQSDVLFEYVAPAFSIVPEQWQHIAWVYDGTKCELFIDGVAKGSTNANGTITGTAKPFGIGKSIFGTFNFVFGGRADEVSLWSKALSVDDIQDMMMNELGGDEEGLELYYKFNQGVPGEDNTSITQLKSEIGNGDRDGNLINFAMMGNTSNFGGELDESFQAITFPQIPNKLVDDADFELMATASSGLQVSYEIVSGPATLNGNMVSLDGTPGEVVIRASQDGDATFDPAESLENSFQVLDPSTFLPVTEGRSPLAGDVMVPTLRPIQLAAISNIDFPELFEVKEVSFEVDGMSIPAVDWKNGHYTAWWQPPAYGAYTLNITSTNNYGASSTESVSFNVVDQASDLTAQASDKVWLNVDIGSSIVEAELPSYIGAFDQITARLDITCPNGGCDPWDRVSGIEAKGHNGQWYEIIRYITPYGIACNSSIDLTDFMSVLQGKIAFRFYLGTQGNGFEYTLNLDYKAGTPAHPYSSIGKLWTDTYDFGNPDDLQPCEVLNVAFPENTLDAKIKLVSTGHGWGDNNTGNAAEFHEDRHHVWIDGTQTFEQHNWADCNPNPDGCNNQNGTWFFDRAGWCPGAIAPWFDFDMDSYINRGSVEMRYIFNESYEDKCHPNNIFCQNGVTCPNCDDGFNPHLIVSSYLISFGDMPITDLSTSVDDLEEQIAFSVFPNPSEGLFNVRLGETVKELQIQVLNNLGQVVYSVNRSQPDDLQSIDLRQMAKGIYFIQISTERGKGMRKLLVR